MNAYPIKLTAHVRTYAFGERLIPELLGKKGLPEGVVAETWHILWAAEDATILAGVKEGLDRDELREAFEATGYRSRLGNDDVALYKEDMLVEQNGEVPWRDQEAFTGRWKQVSKRPVRRLILALAATLLVSVVAAATVFGSDPPASTSSEPVALGAYIPGVKENPTEIDEYSEMVGASPAIVMWFQGWANGSGFDRAMMDAVASRGAMPMVTWEPWDYTESKRQPGYSLRRIAAGKHDRYIRRWARDAARWGGPMYLRFAHEMNADWYSWSAGVNGNTSAEYVAVWRHVVDIFRQEGATNVRWVWSPSVASNGGTPLAELYPGDDYVDWVALDGYNYGSSQIDGGGWRTLAEVFGPSYDKITALAPEKPFMISETASAEEGGDKAAWIRDAFFLDIPARLPKTKAVVWFHKNKLADWRVNSSPSSLAAYSEAAASPEYRGRLS